MGNRGTSDQGRPSIFDGVPSEGLDEILAGLQVRHYETGTVVVAEGDVPHEMYVIRSGTTDVLIADQQGAQHKINSLGPGATFGEMSLFTGQPAAGTVCSSSELDVLVIDEAELDRLGNRFPRIYRNLAAVVSERLARANRLILREDTGRLTVIDDHGAPPLLGYALACSVAWHTKRSTLLLVLDDEPAADLVALAQGVRDDRSVDVVVAPAAEKLGAEFQTRLEELRARYEYVFVQTRGGLPEGLPAHRTIALEADAKPPDEAMSYALRGWEERTGRIGPDATGILNVPPLTNVDEQRLYDGRLPPDSGAGRALGWAARDVAGLKIGVALGSGSVRGFAHFGALRALERNGLPPDCIAGTSVGAAAAGLYALGLNPEEAADTFLRCAPTLFKPTLSTRGFLSMRALRKFLSGVSGDRRIEDLAMPLAIVGADIETLTEVVFRRGLLWQAVLASLAIPGIYPAQPMGQYTVVDGGVINPTPVGVVSDMGADIVIGVHLGLPRADPERDAEAVEASGKPPSAITSILRSIDIMQSRLFPEAGSAATFIVRPELKELPSVPGGRLKNFREGLRYVDDGDAAVEAAMPRIAAALPWLRA